MAKGSRATRVFAFFRTLSISILFCLLLAACNKGDVAPGTGSKIPIFVSISPQAYFAERIGGGHVEVNVLVAPGQSPHTYETTPLQMAELASSKALFTIGMPFEQAVVRQIRASFPNVEIIDTRQGVPMRTIESSEAGSGVASGAVSPAHDHADEAAGQPDPHIWLDPKLVKIQAKTIADALARIDPQHAAQYGRNLKALDADLDATDQKIARMLAPYKGEEFMVFHPAFGYFADAYGLHQIPVETEGKEPGARQLGQFIERARRDNIRVIFVQPQFSTKSAEAVARSIGGKVVAVNDLSKDYLNNLVFMAESIREGLANSSAKKGEAAP